MPLTLTARNACVHNHQRCGAAPSPEASPGHTGPQPGPRRPRARPSSAHPQPHPPPRRGTSSSWVSHCSRSFLKLKEFSAITATGIFPSRRPAAASQNRLPSGGGRAPTSLPSRTTHTSARRLRHAGRSSPGFINALEDCGAGRPERPDGGVVKTWGRGQGEPGAGLRARRAKAGGGVGGRRAAHVSDPRVFKERADYAFFFSPLFPYVCVQ